MLLDLTFTFVRHTLNIGIWNIDYWSIALQMDHCFLAITFNLKWEFFNLIRKIYFNQKTLTKNIFLKFVYVFIYGGIGWTFNILNVLCQITFPSCALDMG